MQSAVFGWSDFSVAGLFLPSTGFYTDQLTAEEGHFA